MPKALSEDLRKRVVEMRRQGFSVADVSSHYGVSRDCVYRWDKLDRETGSLSAGYSRCGRPLNRDMERFEKFALLHAHSTLKQMQAHWEEEVSLMTLSRMLRRIGWTHKKRPTAIESAAH
jgi:transposase